MVNTHVIIRGDSMRGGYIDDLAAKTLAVTMIDGVAYEYDTNQQRAQTWNAPLIIDSEGEITRDGARAGYGFLPDNGELARVGKQGVVFAHRT